MKSQNWYKWFPARYKADTMHLTAEQDGIYRRLIDHYMETTQPLPDSVAALARIAGVSSSELEGNWPILCHFFRENQGKLHLKICDELIQDREQKAQRFSEYGKMGGRPKNNPTLNPRVNPTLKPKLSQTKALGKADKSREDISSLHSDISPPMGSPPENLPQAKTEEGEPQDMAAFEQSATESEAKQKNHSEVAETPKNSPAPLKIENQKGSKNGKGQRLSEWLSVNGPSDGSIPLEWIEWVERKYGWDDATIQHIAERFWRYFTGPDAKEPVKKDWKRAFQNWCDRDQGTAQAFIRARSGSSGGKGQGYSSAVADSTKQALVLLDAGAGSAGEDDTAFPRAGSYA